MNKYKLIPVTTSNGRKIKNLFTRNGVYYISCEIKRKRFLRKSPYQTQTEAAAWVKKFMREARENTANADHSRHRSAYPAIGRIIELYRAAAATQHAKTGSPLPHTVKQNINQLKNIVRRATGASNVDSLPATILTADLADQYFQAVVDPADYNTAHRARVSAASSLRQAKSIFARWALQYYDRHINLPPDIAKFRTAGYTFRREKYRLPPAELRNKTFSEGKKLQNTRPELYLVFMLSYNLGMRAGESAAAKYAWIEPDEHKNGQYVMRLCRRPDWRGPKNLIAHTIPMTHETYNDLIAARRPDSDYILPGATPNARLNLITRRFSTWMRSIGWDQTTYPKAAHELRKLAGSIWYTKAGPTWASAWLGDSLATVCHYYADLTDSHEAVTMW